MTGCVIVAEGEGRAFSIGLISVLQPDKFTRHDNSANKKNGCNFGCIVIKKLFM